MLDRVHTCSTYISERNFLERAARRVVHPHRKCGVCADCGHDNREELDHRYGKKVARKMAEYQILLDICKKNGYLQIKEEIDEKTNHPVHWIRPSITANEMTGVIDLIEALLKSYKLTWSFLLIPIITAILSNVYWQKIMNIINSWSM
jgi:hypothetical protein